jgi:integrase/recombinase XerD
MNVTLREKKIKSGASLYLDITSNGERKKEYLDITISNSKKPLDRKRNKQLKELAESITAKRRLELAANDHDLDSNILGKVSVETFFETYIQRYTKLDVRNVMGVYRKFQQYTKLEGKNNLQMKQLTPALIHGFKLYLEHHQKGEGASSYFRRFKKALKQAVREGIIKLNPADGVAIKTSGSIPKNILTPEELIRLYETPLSNTSVRNAFFFSTYTALRWVDIKSLKWEEIEGSIIRKQQAKTGKIVVIPMHNDTFSFLPNKQSNSDLIFDLPSANGANKLLQSWTKAAGIKKHITWHCARHTFGTNLSNAKIDPTTATSMLGHTTLKYYLDYSRVSEQNRKEAINILPSIFKRKLDI